MIVALIVCAVALVSVLLCALFTVSRLIQHQYQFHRTEWEHDGRPTGYMWRPPEATWFTSQFAFHRCALDVATFHAGLGSRRHSCRAALASPAMVGADLECRNYTSVSMAVRRLDCIAMSSNQALERTADRREHLFR